MKIVKEWLSEFVDIPSDVSDEEIMRLLSLATVEVEGVSSDMEKRALDAIVVGIIKEIQTHPDADRLRVVLVDVGRAELPHIVCGGTNLAVGMSVAVALPGASVRWHGEGEPIVLEKTTIRGVQSDGMICASSEIGLGDRFPAKDDHEILDLSALSTIPGMPLSRLFGNEGVVFEIDNKSLSHRPDLWGHRGMAREVAALFRLPFKEQSIPKIKHGKGKQLTVDVADHELCPRYMGVVVDGVSSAPSPEWMQKRLTLAGLRPINSLVDVTNYVMLEYGQPMHAFDYDTLSERKGGAHIIVRRARDGETIEALDGKQYTLTSETLVIADENNPVAVAGIIGGVHASVNEGTRTIILEAANFNGPSIRRTANAVGIATESSRRFEKHLDPELPSLALARAVSILKNEFPAARVMSAVADRYARPPSVRPLTVTVAMIERMLGVSISLARASGILTALGFHITKTSDHLSVRIPSFRRKDIASVEDVVEEVVRFIGYDAIPAVLPRMPLSEPIIDRKRQIATEVKKRLVYQYGFHEVQLYAFSRKETVLACGLNPDAHFELANPLSAERPLLCRSLIPNLLEAVVTNQQREKNIALFQLSRVFLKGNVEHDPSGDETLDIPSQPLYCACVYVSKEEGNHFAFVRETVSRVCADLGIALDVRKEDGRDPVCAAGRSAGLYCGRTRVGYIGEVSPKTRAALGIDDPVFACEFDVSLLAECSRIPVRYHPLPAFPGVKRDMTLCVGEKRAYADIAARLACAHPLIVSAEPFDVYRDKKIGAGNKSFSFHIVYQSPDRTLTSREVDEAHEKVLNILKKE
ncbi:phenylalanine--tRNA ligase subunit beta [Candidatus Uhrbacteria bacterium]|nr:phenylalanine--tRNA ligase subunit beta [Candidatus Uhrbacteria bacterium]